MTVRWAGPGEDHSDALALRDEVFADEQGYLPRGETDAEDAGAIHLMMLEGTTPVAAGRIVDLGGGCALIGRICVKKALRGQNIGAQVVRLLTGRCREMGMTRIVVRAQLHARGFYERMGFVPCGAETTERGVRHVELETLL